MAASKKRLGFDPEAKFFVPEAVRAPVHAPGPPRELVVDKGCAGPWRGAVQVNARYGAAKARGADAEAEWNALFAKYEAAHPELAAELKRRIAGTLPANWQSALPRFTAKDAAQATRCVRVCVRACERMCACQQRLNRSLFVAVAPPESFRKRCSTTWPRSCRRLLVARPT